MAVSTTEPAAVARLARRPRPAAGGAAVRLPALPKVLIGLGLLIVFLILAVDRPAHRPLQPVGRPGGERDAAAAVGRALARHHPDPAGRAVPAAGRRAGARSSWRSWPGVVATVIAVVVGVTAGYLGGLADDLLSMLANIFLVMPALLLLIVIFGFLPASSDDLLIGAIIALTGWALGRAGAPRADAVAAQPGLRGVGPDHRREHRPDHRLGDRAQPAADHRVLVPVHRPLRRRHLYRDRLPRPGQHRPALELGRHAVLGAVGERPGQRVLVVVHPAGARGRAARHRAGAAQLRHRRVHQPAAAGRRADPEAGPGRRAYRPGSRSASPRSCGCPRRAPGRCRGRQPRPAVRRRRAGGHA